MFGVRASSRKPARDEAEKPFWISFSDLMTALMVLFLIAMTVALLSITIKIVSGPEEHQKKVEKCMADVRGMTEQEFPGVTVAEHTIDFGSLATFETNRHQLDATAERTLRSYVPKVLALAHTDQCSSVFKRVIVEGFASQRGTYLHNLNLSLQRAERVLCILLSSSATNALNESDRKDVRNLFLVGGSSFNALKPTDRDSQRIELKLEFLGYLEKREHYRDAPLDGDNQCPIDR